MHKWNVLWLGLLLSCGNNTADTTVDTGDTGNSDTGTTEPEEPYFNQELELNTTIPSDGTTAFLPLGWYNALAVDFEPPPPPYEIRSLAVMAFNDPDSLFSHGGNDYKCSAAAPLELVAWVDESGDPSSYQVSDAHGVPQLPALASGITTGPSPDEDERIALMRVEFETPIRVNTAGTLYVAARRQEASGGIAPCLIVRSGEESQGMWAHENIAEIPSWKALTSTTDFRVALGTHQAE